MSAVVPESRRPKPATPATIAANQAAVAGAARFDPIDFDEARRGFLGTVEDLEIRRADGRVGWSMNDYRFLDESDQAPDSVHPSLWRHARLSNFHGLFQVADGIYQVRGFDIANMTIVEGETGLVVIDCLTMIEQARAAMALYYRHRPQVPVRAIVYSHNHNDHYGGVMGIVDESEIRSGAIPILAPERFVDGIRPSLAYGAAMRRRLQYHYAAFVPPGERGRVDLGLGKDGPLTSNSVSLVEPTETVAASGETRVIDGVEIEFLLAPDSEAAAEMLMYFPAQRALFAAELANHTLHNIYTPRGIPIRNVRNIWRGLDEALQRYGARSDAVFLCHHWPKWGTERVVEFLEKQRDLYKYNHDQSIRLMNRGVTIHEVGREIELPATLHRESSCAGYYGTLNHNAKGIVQYNLGWFDGNPAKLDPLLPAEAAIKYVEFMGGAAAVLDKARAAFHRGEYRWVAEVVNHVVFAEPENDVARELQADALEQLGYQSESGVWRNFYLAAAHELRHGVPASPDHPPLVSRNMVHAFPPDLYFEHLATRLDGPRADGIAVTLNWRFTDTGERYVLRLKNSVLMHDPDRQADDADATVLLSRPVFDALITGQTTYAEALGAGHVTLDGDPTSFETVLALMSDDAPAFAIVTP